MHIGFPELFPGLAVKAQDRLDLPLFVGSRQKHLVTHDGRRPMSAPGNGALQITFCFRSSAAGASGLALAMPSRLRPRHHGQSVAATSTVAGRRGPAIPGPNSRRRFQDRDGNE